ncbi:hypothetical protein D1007_59301 [Hordeum vulgare]|nr:hypothetical protein D1007_59301 [Hordeum vulgare]
MPPTDCSSLSPDFVSCVGDVFLDAGDIDYYVNLCAVCRSWRAATDEPRSLSRPFRPHRWVMLERDDLSRRVDSRLFLIVDTGRFLRKDLPPNNGYSYIGAADGLLVLEKDRGRAYDICILNSFTDSMALFPHSIFSHCAP